jgi:hypothetical protein
MKPLVSDNDAGDLAAARCGDHEAFARLYDRHAALVLSRCRRLHGGRHEAAALLNATRYRAGSTRPA